MSDAHDLRRARRIVIVSRANGVSGVGVGAIAAILSLVAGDPAAALASLGICAAGALEIAGSRRAARRDPSAPRVLAGSMALSLVSVLALLLRCAVAIDPATLFAWMPASYAETIHVLCDGPGEAEAFLLTGARFTLGLLAVVVALFETGMATFYASSRGVFLRLAAAPPKQR